MDTSDKYIKPLFDFLISIPKGKITTYSITAKIVGLKNPRNVGWILRQNQDPEKIPCYKVIRSDGKLAKGYKFGGPKKQKEKLESEEVLFDEKGKVKEFDKIVFGERC